MNIGLLGDSFRPYQSGGLITGFDMATSDLFRGFFRYSTDTDFFCLCEPGHLQEEAVSEIRSQMEPIRAERIHLVNEYKLLFRGPESLPPLDILHSVKEDAVSALTLREALKAAVPITFTLHGIAEQHLLTDFFYPMLFLPFRPYDAVICTSEAVLRTVERILERLEGIFADALNLCHNIRVAPEAVQHHIRLERIPLGVDTKYFSPMNRNFLREKYQIPQEAFVILWLGRFSSIFKADLFPLVHVFGELVRSNPQRQLLLMLVGSQEQGVMYREELQSELRRQGLDEFSRVLDYREIKNRAELYSVSDVFTSPVDNIQETFGLTPVEAMSCGVPQVVSDWDGYRDTVKDGITGFRVKTVWSSCMDDIAAEDCLPLNRGRRRLIHNGLAVRSVVVDCEEYRKKMQILIDQPELCKEMGSASRICAINNFDLRHCVMATEELWNRLRETAHSTASNFSRNVVPMLNYCKDFVPYPTTYADDNMVFYLSDSSEVERSFAVRQLNLFANTIEEANLTQMIMDSFCRNVRTNIAALSRQFSTYSLSQIRRSVMFLYKYDIIRPLDINLRPQ